MMRNLHLILLMMSNLLSKSMY